MKKYLYLATLIIIALSLFSGCKNENNNNTTTTSNTSQSTTPHPVVQTNPTQNSTSKFQKAPDFALPSVDGELVRLSDYDGKVRIVDFWATWCRPCVMEMPSFVELMKRYSNKSFIVIGVDLDRRISKENLKSFLDSHNINYPIVMGLSDPSILNKFGGIPAIPTTFIIDKNGYIRQKLVGVHSFEDLDNIVRPLLDEKVAKGE